MCETEIWISLSFLFHCFRRVVPLLSLMACKEEVWIRSPREIVCRRHVWTRLRMTAWETTTTMYCAKYFFYSYVDVLWIKWASSIRMFWWNQQSLLICCDWRAQVFIAASWIVKCLSGHLLTIESCHCRDHIFNIVYFLNWASNGKIITH